MRFLRNANIQSLFMIVVLLWIMVDGCGPGQKEIAAREAAHQEIMHLKTQLRESAHQRMASSKEPIPQKVVDPGYEVRSCDIPAIPQEMGFIVVPGCSRCICGNTKAGNEIVAYRKWYCNGINLTNNQYKRCVIAEWQDDEPTFGNIWKYSCKSAIKFEGDPKPRVGETSPFKIQLQGKP